MMTERSLVFMVENVAAVTGDIPVCDKYHIQSGQGFVVGERSRHQGEEGFGTNDDASGL